MRAHEGLPGQLVQMAGEALAEAAAVHEDDRAAMSPDLLEQRRMDRRPQPRPRLLGSRDDELSRSGTARAARAVHAMQRSGIIAEIHRARSVRDIRDVRGIRGVRDIRGVRGIPGRGDIGTRHVGDRHTDPTVQGRRRAGLDDRHGTVATEIPCDRLGWPRGRR